MTSNNASQYYLQCVWWDVNHDFNAITDFIANRSCNTTITGSCCIC